MASQGYVSYSDQERAMASQGYVLYYVPERSVENLFVQAREKKRKSLMMTDGWTTVEMNDKKTRKVSSLYILYI